MLLLTLFCSKTSMKTKIMAAQQIEMIDKSYSPEPSCNLMKFPDKETASESLPKHLPVAQMWPNP